MNHGKLFVVGMLALAALVCGLPDGVTQLRSGPVQTQAISVPLPADTSEPIKVTLHPGAAEVTAGARAAKLIDGSVRYNVPEFQPTVNTTGTKVAVAVGVSPTFTNLTAQGTLVPWAYLPLIISGGSSPQPSLSVALAGTGAGNVTSAPGTINCPTGLCANNYVTGTVVTLSATPANNSTFTGWSGSGCSGTGTFCGPCSGTGTFCGPCSGTGTCVVTVMANTNVTANFAAITSIWRPFSDDSPWNTPIGPNPQIDPNSAAMIATLDPSHTGDGFWINKDFYTVPVYDANASTPTYHVPCINPWDYCGSGFGENVPIPDGAMPDPESDGHMAIVDLSRNLSWDMYQAEHTTTGWTVYGGWVFDLTSTGVLADGQPSARASGFPLMAGLIRLEEIQRGHIAHALVMAYDAPRAGEVYVYPASVAFGCVGGANAIPMGGRIQLDPALNLDSLGLSPGAKVIARALQEYGAYLGDQSDGLILFAEGLYGKPGQSWTGILDSHDLQIISTQHYRVIKLPPLKIMPDM